MSHSNKTKEKTCKNNQEHIRFGNDGDLRIYHTAGGDSTIEHNASGTDLKIITTATGDDIILESEDDIMPISYG